MATTNSRPIYEVESEAELTQTFHPPLPHFYRGQKVRKLGADIDCSTHAREAATANVLVLIGVARFD